MRGPYKRFPPRWRHIRVPVGPRADALAALSLYAPCRAGGRLLHGLAWWGTRGLGARVLPGRSREWTAPIQEELWHELLANWRDRFGEFHALGVYESPQTSRSGLGLLLIGSSGPRAFVKIRAGWEPETTPEAKALELIGSFRPKSFTVPTLLEHGRAGNWGYVALSALPAVRHRPGRDAPISGIAAEIQEALSDLPRLDGAEAHWRPMHGDLTPWNLRYFPGAGLALVDWERAGWGPPGADEVLYRAMEAALGWVRPAASPHREAVRFWLDRTDEDLILDQRLRRRLVGALRSMDT